jgi:hypothetical protein
MAESHTEGWGGLFTRLSIRLKPGVRGIDQASYPTEFRDSHLQKLQVFAGDLKFGVRRKSCDVAAWTGKTRDVTLAHRVERYHHHDRDCRGSSFRRSDRGRIGSNEHITFETSQLGRELLNLFWAIGPPVLDSDVLPRVYGNQHPAHRVTNSSSHLDASLYCSPEHARAAAWRAYITSEGVKESRELARGETVPGNVPTGTQNGPRSTPRQPATKRKTR